MATIAELFSEKNKTKFQRSEKKSTPSSNVSTSRKGGEIKKKKAERSDEDETERLTRTVFVGNVPASDLKPSELKRFFRDAGKVESVRVRSLAVMGTKVEKAGNQGAVRKACFIKGALNSEAATTCNAYIVFKNIESVEKALELNGKVFNDHHLNVDRATASGEGTKRNDHRRSVFVGNICFTASEEDVYRFFLSQVGEDSVDRVRLIRDSETRMGKGIGYVSFKSPMSVLSALALDGKFFVFFSLALLIMNYIIYIYQQARNFRVENCV